MHRRAVRIYRMFRLGPCRLADAKTILVIAPGNRRLGRELGERNVPTRVVKRAARKGREVV